MKKQTLIIGIIGIFLFIQPIGAQTWDPSKRLTWNSTLSYHPDIIADPNDNIHVVLHDSPPGNLETYYK
jgi:hypothetical protein